MTGLEDAMVRHQPNKEVGKTIWDPLNVGSNFKVWFRNIRLAHANQDITGEHVTAVNELLAQNLLPILFIFAKETHLDFSEPQAIAVITTVHTLEKGLLPSKTKPQARAYFVPVMRHKDGWELDLSDDYLAQSLTKFGIHWLFSNFNVLGDESSFQNARAEAARQSGQDLNQSPNAQ